MREVRLRMMKRLMSIATVLLVGSSAVAQTQPVTPDPTLDPASLASPATTITTTTITTTTYDPSAVDCWKPTAKGEDPKRDPYGRLIYQIDCRGSFEGSFYIGGAVDTFAGNDTLNYLNASDTGKSTLREVAGFDFAYRLYGTRGRLNPGDTGVYNFAQRSQLWVYGETVHGVRSKELQCVDAGGNPGTDANLPACKQAADPNNIPNTGELLAIIKGATSLEAFFGLRWEFAPVSSVIQGSELDRARFYVKTQFGAINVASGGDSADQHHVGLGAIAVSGPLEGSYLEVGYGRNDLMVKNHDGRWKVDGFLSVDARAVPMLHKIVKDRRIRPFAQLTVDADLAGGADSLQTYFGLDYTFGGTN